MDRSMKISFCVVTTLIIIIGCCLIYYTWQISFGDDDDEPLRRRAGRPAYRNKFNLERHNFDLDEDLGNIETESQPTSTSATSTDVSSDLTLHKNYNLFNQPHCGWPDMRVRIVNGEKTQLMANPWMVAIYYHNATTGEDLQSCAGTLISG